MQQVGYGSSPAFGPTPTPPQSIYHALLWSGTADSIVDLNPSGFVFSSASATDGNQQVGFVVTVPRMNILHAMLWSGTAASAVDLNPSGFGYSRALGVGGGQQVGLGIVNGGLQFQFHALLWAGTANSGVDLNPDGFNTSSATATNGIQQVGGGELIGDSGGHALVWSGTAASAVDLQNELPSTDSWQFSTATSIDESGNIFGLANDDAGSLFAVEWSPVPEPASAVLVVIGIAIIVAKQGDKQSLLSSCAF